jgi:predicted ATPase/class 3 adenylate cyclase
MAERRDLPAGTVTFLFTDVEGSTRLLHELGSGGYAEALGAHRRIVRGAAADHGGVEVDTAGDAFFLAFATATGALTAATEIRNALADGPIRLRIGLHTGTPLLTDEGYVGTDVHRAARIAAAGHGGQVLLSATTAALVGSDGLLDLGEHRLKDLAAPEHIHQLGAEAFPPLASLYRTNLPVPATPFLGREDELAEIAALFERPDVRLLTLTGPGGTGKTRLSMQAAAGVADRFPDGVWWAPLAPIRDPRLVIAMAASVVGAPDDLAGHIGARRVLLVLDNFEQVIEAAGDVADLLTACPNIRVVVTSRERLAIPGEHVYPVPPLAPPEGVELFTTRARAIVPGFMPDATVQRLCDRLDNLPLAIELAASRVGTLSIAQLHERLSKRLDLLKGGRGVDERQRTIRAAIEWSHDLLSSEDQRHFARLAVFRGGWTLEAAEEVAGADLDTLQSLFDKSLVRRVDARFGMLETIRDYAEERLEASGDVDEFRRRHAAWYLALAESANLSLDSVGRGPQRHDLILPEAGNMRAALEWATGTDVEFGLRLAVALANFWVVVDPDDGAHRFEALLDRAPARLDTLLRARAVRDLGGCLQIAGRPELAQVRYEESLALYEAAGDEPGVLHMLHRLGSAVAAQGDVGRAHRLLDESLEGQRRIGNVIGELQVLGTMGHIAIMEGDMETALAHLTRSLAMARTIGWTWWEANTKVNLAETLLRLGRHDEAEPYALGVLGLAEQMSSREDTIFGLGQLAWIAAARGDADRAATLWRAVEQETARRSCPSWAVDRDLYAEHVGEVDLAVPALGLEEAVDLALAGALVTGS